MFKVDGKFYYIMSYVFDLLVLNFLFILLCLPVVTIGANLAALTTVTIKMTNHEQPSILKTYWFSFKENFGQSTAIWLILCVLLSSCYINFNYWSQIEPINSFLLPLLFIFCVFILLFTLYIFQVISRYENSLFHTIKNSFLIMLAYLPTTILLLLVCFSPVLLFFFIAPSWLGLLVYFYLLIGVALTFLVNSKIFNLVFVKLSIKLP